MSDLSQESPLWREWAEALRMVVAADTAEDWSRAVDYARAALAKAGVSQPIPLYEAMPASHKPTYDDAAIRELIVTIQSNREAIRRALEAWDTTTNSKSHDGHLWQCMEELRMEIEK